MADDPKQIPLFKKKIRGKTREQKIHDAVIAEHIARLKNPSLPKSAPINVPAGAHIAEGADFIKNREEKARQQVIRELQEKMRKRRLAEEEGD